MVHAVLGILMVVVAIMIPCEIFAFPENTRRNLLAFGVVELGGLGLLGLNRRGRPRDASILLVAGLVTLITGLAWTAGGMRAPVIVAFLPVVFFSGVLLGGRAGFLTGAICVLLELGLVYAKQKNLLPFNTVSHDAVALWLSNLLAIAVVGGTQNIFARSLRDALRRSRDELTERGRIESALRVSEERYRLLVENSSDLVAEIGVDGTYFYVSPNHEAVLGYAAEQLMNTVSFHLVHPNDLRRLQQLLAQKEGAASYRMRHRGGSWRWFESFGRQFQTSRGDQRCVIVSRDITEFKASDGRIRRLNRLYAVSSGINEAIVRTRDPRTLYEQACRIAVEQGQFRLAWVALHDPATSTLRPAVRWGVDDGYLDLITISTRNVPEGRGPAGVAFRTGEFAFSNDIENDPSFPWREQALARDYRSCAAFPLNTAAGCLGIVVVYADQVGYFNEEELRLLNALADNLGLATESAERESRRRQAEAAIEYRLKVESLITSISTRLIHLRADQAATEIFQTLKSASEFVGVDRAWVSSYVNEREPCQSIVHEWCAEGIIPVKPRYQRVPVSRFPFLTGALLRGELIHVARVNELAAEADAERAAMEAGGVKSMLIIPRVIGGTVVGGVGFDSLRAEKTWTPDAIALLKIVGEIITSALQRLEAEQALRQSEERYELAVRGSMDGLFDWNILTNEVYYSPRWKEQLGYSEHELPNHLFTFSEHLHPDDAESTWSRIKAHLEKRDRYDTEFRLRTKLGDYRWFRSRAQAIWDDDAKPVRLAGSNTDITEQKNAELAILKSEEKFSKAFHASPDTIVITSLAEGRLIEVNEGFVRNTGYQRDEAIGKTVFELRVWPREVDRESLIESLRRDGYVRDLPHDFRTKSGEIRSGVLTAEKVEVEGEECLLSVIRDITEAKRSELDLRKSEERYRLLVENSNDLVCEMTPDGRALYVSPNHVKLSGHQPEALVGTNLLDLVHPDDLAKVAAVLAQEATIFVYRARHGNGSWRSLESSTHTFRTSAGERRFVVISRDITERREADERLRQQADLLDLANDAIFVRDLEDRISFWNRGAQDLYGWAAHEARGQKLADLARGIPAALADAKARLLENGNWRGDLRILNRQGKEVIVDSHWTLLRDAEGRPAAILSIDSDVTEKKSLETQFYHAQRMEAIGTLAGGMAHDFNNIVGAILGYVGLAKDDAPDNGELQADLAEISKAAHRAKEVIKQILTFSRLQEHSRKPVQLHLIAQEAFKLIRATLPSTIEIRLKVEGAIPVVLADATQMHQVLMNLATNAGHAMQERGGSLEARVACEVIDIETAQALSGLAAGRCVVLSVADTGHGMSETVRRRIFDPFFTTKAPGEGTGLGLSVVHGIVKNHGGAITVTSEVGRGTTFKIYLPCVQDAPDEEARPTAAPSPGAGQRVLFVDDEKSLADAGGRYLTRLGYRVTTSLSGHDALERFAERPEQFDLVVTDLTMPRMTGLQLATKLWEIRPTTPIVITTGYNARMTAESVQRIGIRELLMKPYSPATLAETIARVLRPTPNASAPGSGARA